MPPPAPLLVMGFGPFLEIADNPAARLALAVDGRDADGRRIVGRVMPVSYRRAVEETVRAVEALAPVAVLGIGVARGRTAAMIERWGHAGATAEHLDVDGRTRPAGGPDRVATHSPDALAAALRLAVSEDAGRYVCNAWIHEIVPRVGRPVAFLHVPDDGFDADRLRSGLAAWAPTLR